MIWGLLIFAVVALFLVFAKIRSKNDADVKIFIQRDHLNSLTPEEQQKLANDCRNAAFEGYKQGFEFANSAGKSLDFCHQVGILEAARCVLVNAKENRENDKITRALQMETAPFNKIEADLSRRAFTEYLVWKFFPEQANVSPIQEVMRQFVNNIYDKNPDSVSGNAFRYDAIYSKKYDWQRFALAAANERAREVK